MPDSQKIKNVIEDHGGKAILTSPKHKMGLREFMKLPKNSKIRIIVDIQGDQPLINPRSIDQTIEFHRKNKNFEIVLPCMPIKYNRNNSSLVKVIFTDNGKIIYFSRATHLLTIKKKFLITKIYRLFHLNQKH